MNTERHIPLNFKAKQAAGTAGAVLTISGFASRAHGSDNVVKVELLPRESAPVIQVDQRLPISPDIVARQEDTAAVFKKSLAQENLKIGKTWEGTATYYSRDGCVGCSADMLMANGEPLDDSRLTAAFNRAPLGTKLRVTNKDTGLSAIVEVTDTGGFDSFGRLIDLTPASRDAIGGGDLTQVVVEELLVSN